jgi:hypothetical protein
MKANDWLSGTLTAQEAYYLNGKGMSGFELRQELTRQAEY